MKMAFIYNAVYLVSGAEEKIYEIGKKLADKKVHDRVKLKCLKSLGKIGK